MKNNFDILEFCVLQHSDLVAYVNYVSEHIRNKEGKIFIIDAQCLLA